MQMLGGIPPGQIQRYVELERAVIELRMVRGELTGFAHGEMTRAIGKVAEAFPYPIETVIQLLQYDTGTLWREFWRHLTGQEPLTLTGTATVPAHIWMADEEITEADLYWDEEEEEEDPLADLRQLVARPPGGGRRRAQ